MRAPVRVVVRVVVAIVVASALISCARSNHAPMHPDGAQESRAGVGDGTGDGQRAGQGQGAGGQASMTTEETTRGQGDGTAAEAGAGGPSSEPHTLDTPFDAPPDGVRADPDAVGATEVWAGQVAGFADSDCWNERMSGGPMTFGVGAEGLGVVLILDTTDEGEPIAASLLFGEGEPPPPPSDEPVTDPFAISFPNCFESPAEGFEYPVQHVERDGQRLQLVFSPMDVYRPWCRAQQPIPVPPEKAADLGSDHVCRDPDGPSTPAADICWGQGATHCVCEPDGCDLEAPTALIDLFESDGRLDGFMQSSFTDVISNVPRIVLTRVE